MNPSTISPIGKMSPISVSGQVRMAISMGSVTTIMDRSSSIWRHCAKIALPIIRQQQLSKNEQMEEEMILGLRTMVGVSQKHFAEKFKTPLLDQYAAVVSDLVADGLLLVDGDRIRLTQRGVFLGNEVFRSFLM